jgi:FAD/FMN-containing dehydrogenase
MMGAAEGHGEVVLQSYGRLDRVEAEVWEPADVPALARMLARAIADGRKVTLRAGGHSFHDQALNDDLVISLAALNRIIDIDVAARTICVEAGARWGDILDAALAHDLVPYVVVTTSEATAGGTLATDGISRHSPSYGAESVHVVSFDLLIPGEHEARTIHQPLSDADDRDAAIFRAVIGGFGYLGVVTRVVHRLLDVSSLTDRRGPLQVATRLTAVHSFAELVDEQLRPSCEALGRGAIEERVFPARASELTPALYAIAFPKHGDGQGAVYRSWYTRGHALRPYLVFRPRYWLRILLGFLAGFSWILRIGRRIAWWFVENDAREQISFIDDAREFLFFMDANVLEKKIGERMGLPMPVIQQTFVVPVARTAAFLGEAVARMDAAGVTPTLLDVLYMPEDRITMSASHRLEGFACTLSFEDVRTPARREQAIGVLRRLATRCADFGGRIHMTKHVYASARTLARMYGPRLTTFMRLKRELDPHGVLHNAFFVRVFEEPAALAAAGEQHAVDQAV